MSYLKNVCVVTFVTLISYGARADGPGTLRVEVTGLRNDQGVVRCTLYSSADGFPSHPDKSLARQEAKATGKQATCTFPGIAPGNYAVAVFHDEDKDGKLKTNFMGIPKEGTGASNGAKGKMGPPKFADARFAFAGAEMALPITIAY